MYVPLSINVRKTQKVNSIIYYFSFILKNIGYTSFVFCSFFPYSHLPFFLRKTIIAFSHVRNYWYSVFLLEMHVGDGFPLSFLMGGCTRRGSGAASRRAGCLTSRAGCHQSLRGKD